MATLHEITSIGYQYRVYPKNSPYPHISISVDDIATAPPNYSFAKFHYSTAANGARVSFSVNALNQWVCDKDGKFVPPGLKPDIQKAKELAEAFLVACGHNNSWAWG